MKTIYIAQETLGQNTGQTEQDAHSMAWLNDGANWGEGYDTVNDGDEIRFVGIITSGFVPSVSS